MPFRVLMIGATGQVGSTVVRALAEEPSCTEVVMANRRAIALTGDPRLRQVVFDTAAPRFSADVTTLARSMVAHGGHLSPNASALRPQTGLCFWITGR